MEAPTDFLGTNVEVEVDRPLGSQHPEFGWEYELNYGFVPNTVSGDGEELDAYIIGVDEPVESFTGICVAIVHRLNDNEDKLVVAPDDGHEYNEAEIREATYFQEQYFQSEIILAS